MRQVAVFFIITALLYQNFSQPASAPVIITTVVATAPAAPVIATTAACAAFGWWCYHAIKAHRLTACHKYLRTVLTDEQYQAFCREQKKYLSRYRAEEIDELSKDERASLIETLTTSHEPAYLFQSIPTFTTVQRIRVKRTEQLKHHQEPAAGPHLTPEATVTQPCMGIYEQYDSANNNVSRSYEKVVTDNATEQPPGKSHEDCRCSCHDLRVGITAPLCLPAVTCCFGRYASMNK